MRPGTKLDKTKKPSRGSDVSGVYVDIWRNDSECADVVAVSRALVCLAGVHLCLFIYGILEYCCDRFSLVKIPLNCVTYGLAPSSLHTHTLSVITPTTTILSRAFPFGASFCAFVYVFFEVSYLLISEQRAHRIFEASFSDIFKVNKW